MKIITVNFDKPIPFKKPTALCLGYFDGVHRGHQAIFNQAIQSGLDVSVLTFDRPPQKKRDQTCLTTLDDRIHLFKKWNVKLVLIISFTEQVKKMTPQAFINFLNQLNVKQVFCGYDFHFGHKAQGDVHHLKYGIGRLFNTVVVEEVTENGNKISTSRIIEHIRFGAPMMAMTLLGRPYCVRGKVVPGKKYGKKLGFPTANIQLDTSYVMPLNGVYATLVKFKNKTYYSMSSIGVHPTINPLEKPLLETHIFDFSKRIYRQNIGICFLQFIRPEIKFEKVESLRLQMNKDKNDVLSLKQHLLNREELS